MSVVEVDVTNFKQIVSKNRLVVLDFWDDWCPPCVVMAPYFEKLAEKYRGKAVFGKVKVGDNPALAMAFDIEAIPTVLIFKDGEVIKRIVGFPGGTRLMKMVGEVIESALRERGR